MWKLSLKRWRYRSQLAGTTLQQCWQQALPDKGTDWRSVSFLVCDAEMSSLDVSEGELLSVGWVCIEGGSIALDSAKHYLLKTEKTVGQSAAIHQLRDCELREGLSKPEVLNLFLAAAAGKILVFHNAVLDMAYLNRCSQQYFGTPLILPTIDTMALEHSRLNRHDSVIKPGDLRLQGCRDRYNLPPYPGHNALVDALATAELLIAQTKHRSGGKGLKLAELF
ncbi:MAG: 3'-5' exonuclease [Halioglobus sp.]